MRGRLILVTGGSGSGESAFAELTLLSPAEGRPVYLATMDQRDDESLRRIARHRDMRQRHGAAAGKSFVTVERPVDIGGAAVEPGDCVLLEDLGNLLSNEIWSPGGAGGGAEEAILAGIDALLDRAALLVVVSNEIFSDGEIWTGDMARYVRGLGRLHRALAAWAETVAEVVCGIPIYQKEGGPAPEG